MCVAAIPWSPVVFSGGGGAKSECVKHLGRIPAILHIVHANITRLDALPLARSEPKYFRWGAPLHVGPDAISRHPEGRERLAVAKASEWTRHRATIKGVQKDIEDGPFDDEVPSFDSRAF